MNHKASQIMDTSSIEAHPPYKGQKTADMLSQLPMELITYILCDACLLSTSFCTALSDLSKWTRTLALPFLYRTIVIKKQGPSAAFSQLVSEIPIYSPQPHFKPKDHVKNLWVSAVSNRVLAIFEVCDNVVNLALHAENFLWLVHASTSNPSSDFSTSVLRPRSITRKSDLDVLIISAKKPNWSLINFVPSGNLPSSPVFAKITHLRIGSIGSYSSYLELAHFKRLTHIAVPYHRPGIHHLQQLLRVFDFPATVFLVVVFMTDEITDENYEAGLRWIAHVRSTNPKVYAVPAQLCNLQQEWEDEVRGGLSIWNRAENFTEALT